MSSSDAIAPPPGYEWYAGQVAGHRTCLVKQQIGILKRPGSAVIHKPCQKGTRGEREVNTYQLILSNEGDEKERGDKETLRTLVPRFDGVERMLVGGEEHKFLVLEDITTKYSLPVILDVKMGLKTYDPHATEKKRAAENAKYPPQTCLGFRFCGYHMHTPEGVVVKDKNWGMSFDETTINQAFAEYLSARPLSEVVPGFIDRLNQIANWFETQRLLHFYASSLLLIYEADPILPPSIDVRMIDLSHAYDAEGKRDSNYIPGLAKLIDIFESLYRSKQ